MLNCILQYKINSIIMLVDKLRYELNRKEQKMSKKINGETWYLVDTICDDDLIYDVYENDRDEVIYEVVGTLY